MKKNLSILLALGIFARMCQCQVPTTSASPVTTALPSDHPIIQRMPDFSQWTIDFTYAKKAEKSSDKLREWQKLATKDPNVAASMADPKFVYALDPARPLHVTVTKTGDIRSEEWTYERNLKGELWSDGQTVVQRKPDSGRLDAATIPSSEASEFPEFNWVSKRNYKETESRNGIKCFMFKDHVPLLTIEHPELAAGVPASDIPKVDVAAYVDIETHYPVLLQIGDDRRAYTILPPPKAEQVIPPEFEAIAKQTKARIQEQTKSLSPP